MTRLVTDGPEDAPVVVFVPGATLPMFVWDGLIEMVAAAGYRTVRYDLPGRGDSTEAGPYTLARYRTQLDDVIGQVAPDGRVHLVALAFGGLIAAPNARALSLTLLAPDGFGIRLPRGAALFTAPVLGPVLGRMIGPRILRRRLGLYSTDPAVVADLRRRFAPYAAAPRLAAATRAALREPIHDGAAVYAGGRTTPTMVLWGAADRIAPLPARDRLDAAFPGARVIVIEGAGHLPHLDRPATTVPAVIGFLRSVSPR